VKATNPLQIFAELCYTGARQQNTHPRLRSIRMGVCTFDSVAPLF
jgi:hypothetical protein